MAFGAFIQGTSKDAGTVSSSTLAYGSNVTAGNSLTATIRQGGVGNLTTTVSDSVNAGNWTKDVDNVLVSNAGSMSKARRSNVGAGATTVTVTFASATTMRWGQNEYTGNFGLDVTPVTATGNSTAPASGSITTTRTCVVQGGMVGANNIASNSASAGSGWTERENLLSSSGATVVAVVDSNGTVAAGSYNPTFSWGTADDWGCFAVGYYDLDAGAALDVPLLQPLATQTVWRM